MLAERKINKHEVHLIKRKIEEFSILSIDKYGNNTLTQPVDRSIDSISKNCNQKYQKNDTYIELCIL